MKETKPLDKQTKKELIKHITALEYKLRIYDNLIKCLNYDEDSDMFFAEIDDSDEVFFDLFDETGTERNVAYDDYEPDPMDIYKWEKENGDDKCRSNY